MMYKNNYRLLLISVVLVIWFGRSYGEEGSDDLAMYEPSDGSNIYLWPDNRELVEKAFWEMQAETVSHPITMKELYLDIHNDYYDPTSISEQVNQRIQQSEASDALQRVSRDDIENRFVKPVRKIPWDTYEMDWFGPNVCMDELLKQRHQNDFINKVKDIQVAYKETSQTRHKMERLMEPNIARICNEKWTSLKCVEVVAARGIEISVTTVRKCCPGFIRHPNSTQCVRNEFTTLKDVLGLEGYDTIIKDFESQNIDLMNAQDYTLFVPGRGIPYFLHSGTPMATYVSTVYDQIYSTDVYTYGDLTLNHMLSMALDITNIVNNTLLQPLYTKSSIRVTTYPKDDQDPEMIALNCVEVAKASIPTRDGYVNMMNGVIPVAIMTIKETILVSPNMSYLHQILKFPKFAALLERPDDEPFTMFLPNSDAFDNIPLMIRHLLLTGADCALGVLQSHIVTGMSCGIGFMRYKTVQTELGSTLTIKKTFAGKYLINDDESRIVHRDIIAKNGVIHMIDNFVLPDAVRALSQSLEANHFHVFLSMLRKYKLERTFNFYEDKTLFLPTDEAFHAKEFKEVEKNLQEVSMRALIRYFVTGSKLYKHDFLHNDILTTDVTEKGRVNVYITGNAKSILEKKFIYTYSCSLITAYDVKAAGLVVHGFNKVMYPPYQTILDILDSNKKYTIFRRLVRNTDAEKTLEGDILPMTLLLPPNDVLLLLPPEYLKTLYKDRNQANDYVKAHILRDTLCCAGIPFTNNREEMYIRTISGVRYKYLKNSFGDIIIGNVVVQKCDEIASNGVVHEVSNALFPDKLPNPYYEREFLDFYNGI